MSTPLLEIKNLSGGYDPIQIFSGVDLTMDAGSSIGLFRPERTWQNDLDENHQWCSFTMDG